MDSDQEENNNTFAKDRKTYLRHMLNQMQDIEERGDVGTQAATKVCHILEQLNTMERTDPITDRIQNIDETLLDINVLKLGSELTLKCVEAVDVSSSIYEPDEFVAHLINHLCPATENDNPDWSAEPDVWLKLLQNAKEIITEVSTCVSMFGAFEELKEMEAADETQTEKQKPQRQRRKQGEATGEHQKLQKITRDTEEEESIDVTINQMMTVLKAQTERDNAAGRPISYFRFVIDTEDFGETVRNIFYTSFLIRNGKARLNVDANTGVPTLELMSKKGLKSFRAGDGRNNEMITSIDMIEWEDLVDTMKASNIEKGYLQEIRST